MSDRPHVIVGLGEVLWDVFPDGARLGGAPANFSCHAAGLGEERVKVHLVSSVGDDDLGHRALESLSTQGVNTSFIQQSDRPTGRVLVSLDEQGKATYEFAADSSWDRLAWNETLRDLAAECDIVCFGSLGQRSEESRQTIQKFLDGMRPESIRVFDINVRPPFVDHDSIRQSLRLANVLKLNDEELSLVGEICGLHGKADEEMLREVADQYSLRAAALTRGAGGSLLIRGEESSDLPGVETEVIDTVGAGDSFTATMALGLLHACGLDAINRNAAEVAAFVCTQAGATPDLPSRLRETIRKRC